MRVVIILNLKLIKGSDKTKTHGYSNGERYVMRLLSRARVLQSLNVIFPIVFVKRNLRDL